MINLGNHLEAIIKQNGATPKNWKDVVSIINAKADESKEFCSYIKQLIKECPTPQKILALDLLDYVMVECNLPLHNQVSSKDFITFLLTLLKTKDSPEVQFKILILIKRWGIRFENKKDILPNFFETYNSLKNSGVIFPDNIDSTYFNYLGDNRSNNNKIAEYPDISNLNINLESNVKVSTSNTSKSISKNILPNNYGNVCLDLNPDNYPKKFKKFVGELVTLLNYITLANEMIDNVDYKQKKLDEGVREIISVVRDLDKNLQLAIENQIDHEKLMAICLGINDDIIKLFKRYDDLKAHKKPEPFLSSFHTDYVAYNLNHNINNQVSSDNYSGMKVDTGKQINKNATDNKNLLEFDFFENNNNTSSSNTSVPQSQTQNTNLTKNNPSKIKDINDIFDAFK